MSCLATRGISPRRRMARLSRFLGLTLFVTGYVHGQISIPGTPPGSILQAWLDALNAGDRASIEDYIRKFDPSESVESILKLKAQTGGFELMAIENSQPFWVQFRARGRATSNIVIGVIRVKTDHPPTVGTFDLRAIPRGAAMEDLDASTRKKVISGVAANVKDAYLFPEVAEKAAAHLMAGYEQGDFDMVTNGYVLASLLTYNLQEISHDLHLRVRYSPSKLPEATPGVSTEDQLRLRKQLEETNCGFEQVKILQGNNGYLKFNMFADPAFCGPTAVAAMAFVAHTNALIFDLRENGGGESTMIALISSYLFDKPTHLNDLNDPRANSTIQSWTLPFIPGSSMAETPVFVLTSSSTFSGAEEFAYDLQNLKRATIVGEITGGGAHAISRRCIDDHFTIGVPYLRAVNPVSKANWEGVGVQPDVRVPASEALAMAEKLAALKRDRN